MPPREALEIKARGIQSGYDLLRQVSGSAAAAGERLSRDKTLERLRAMDKARLEMERLGMEKEFKRQEAVRIKGEMQGRGYLDAAEGRPFDPAIHDPVQYRMGRPVFLQKQAFDEVAKLPSVDEVMAFKPADEFQARARKERLGELADMGALERQKKMDEERAAEKQAKLDTSKSITAASSVDELDRIDPGADRTLDAMMGRKRKVLEQEQDKRLGAALANYTGDIKGLPEHLKAMEVEFDDRDLARAEQMVFRRVTAEKVKADMEAAAVAEKAGNLTAAMAGYQKAQGALNAQIDDIEKKAMERDLVTGSVTYDLSRLTPEDQTLLTRLKMDRLKVVDALTGLATSDPTRILQGMTPEQKRAMGEALLREIESK